MEKKMPIPTPKNNENKNEFLSRCMSDETMKKEYSDTKQRTAVCLSKSNNQEQSFAEQVQDSIFISTSEYDDDWDEFITEISISGNVYDEDENIITANENKKVKLNKPFRTPGGPKKFSVYVKNDKGNVVKVNFGDPNMEIKRDNLDRRKSFRARHNCSNPGPKWKARYWSCKMWSTKPVSANEESHIDKNEIVSQAEKNRPGLWENIRKKKEKMKDKYRPSKPGSPNRPDKEQWDKLTKADQELEEYKSEFYGMIIGALKSIKFHSEQILENIDNPSVKENLSETFLQQVAALAEDYVITIHSYAMFDD
jgi:hypothetical protein